MDYKEIKQDLFKINKSYALAHCISQDCKMGAGIAKDFNRRYPTMKSWLIEEEPRIGEVLSYYANDSRVIFNLITKEKYWQKPTYQSFTDSIKALKNGMEALNINKLAIPLLGAGLDRLSWSKNREIIKEIFLDTNVEIIVCKL